MKWSRKAVLERGKHYVDHIAEDDKHRVAEGYDTEAAADGFPYSLLASERGTERFVRQFDSIASAKRFAEKRK